LLPPSLLIATGTSLTAGRQALKEKEQLSLPPWERAMEGIHLLPEIEIESDNYTQDNDCVNNIPFIPAFPC